MLEKVHRSAEGDEGQEVDLGKCPRALVKMLQGNKEHFLKMGFNILLIKARLRLATGGADTYACILVSPDYTSTAELTHVRVPRVFAFWPQPLPFSKVTGPAKLTLTFESAFQDGTFLVTSTDPEMKGLEDTFSSLAIQVVSSSSSAADLWRQHQLKRDEITRSNKTSCILFDSKEAFFRKEITQRKLITEANKREMTKLREESAADLWDNE